MDAWHFEELVDHARDLTEAEDYGQAIDTLDRALALWGGEPLPDLHGWPIAAGEVERLRQLHYTAQDRRLEVLVDVGRYDDAVVSGTQLAAMEPLRERRWELLALALYRSGHQADALRALSRAREVLRDELGVEPRRELTALERAMLRQDPELAAPDTSYTGRAVDRPPVDHVQGRRSGRNGGNLPTQLTRFFGREEAAAALLEVVDQAPVVTLVGAPGCGKSRLAIEVGGRMARNNPGGAWFVELAPISDQTMVANAVAGALGVREQPGRDMADTLAERLTGAEPLLVVLDNCEHVVDAVRELVRRLAASCPSVRILATSRRRLGLPGEQVWKVPPLELAAAVDLFIDRAQLASSDFRADRTQDAAIEAVCHRLDGLPLAIELTAAWTRVLSVDQITDRLASQLPTLAGGAVSADHRHETMAATVEWSCSLLSPADRMLFEQLSVFAGTFDLPAVEAVAAMAEADVLSGLTRLVDHSLVLADASHGGPMRYRLLEPVRQCGATALVAGGENDAVRRRHARHYLTLAEQCDPLELVGDRSAFPLAPLDQEAGNLLGALHWARTQPSPDLGVRLGVALTWLWQFRGPLDDGRRWLEEMLDTGVPDDELRTNALWSIGRLAWRQGDYEGATTRLNEGLALARQLDDPPGSARIRALLGLVAASTDDPGTAIALCEEDVAFFQSRGDHPSVMSALLTLGWARYAEGNVTAGAEHMRQVLTINDTFGNVTYSAIAHVGAAFGAFLAGDTIAQRQHLLAALAAMRDTGALFDDLDWLGSGAALAAREGRFHAAVRIVGGAFALGRSTGSQLPKALTRPIEALFENIVQQIGQATTDQLVAEGAHMTIDELIAQVVAKPDENHR